MSEKNSDAFNNYRTSYTHSRKRNPKKKKYKNKKNQEEKKENPVKFTSKFDQEDKEKEKEKDSPKAYANYEDEYKDLTYQLKPMTYEIYPYPEEGYKEDYYNFRTKWKTEICHYWEMYGECKYGDSCAFAHGESELKKRKLTFNYKTKPCKQFFELGYCSYGCRCQFSHKKEESIKEKEDNVSYLKIIKEFLSDESTISHELIKRPRLMTFEKITCSTLEESENSKLKLYEDILNIKNSNSNKTNNLIFKASEDSNYTNVSSDNNIEKEIC